MTTALPESRLPESRRPETGLPELHLSGGLAGFPDAQRYALVEVPDSPLFLLRSLDEEGLEFVVVPPVLLFPDYAPEIDDADAAALDLATAQDVLLLVVLTVGIDVASTTANLLAPVVVNQRTRRAAQVVLAGDWSLRAPLHAG